MTLKSAASIMELEVILLRRERNVWVFGAFDGIDHVSPVVTGIGTTERAALERLVKNNWHRVSRLVLERANYRCENCGAMVPVQVHHKKFRSHGRKDTPPNLEAVCLSCHEAAHGRR